MMDAKKHIDKAFNLLNAVSVKGESVDILFMAKEELRAAFKLLNEEENNG